MSRVITIPTSSGLKTQARGLERRKRLEQTEQREFQANDECRSERECEMTTEGCVSVRASQCE